MVESARLDTVPHVILGCFSRGGSSLVWNLLASHPDLSSPGRETHELFVGCSGDPSGRKWRRHLRDAAYGGGLPRPRVSAGHVLPNVGLFEPSNLSTRTIPNRLHEPVRSTVLAAPSAVAPAVDPVLAESSPGSGDVTSSGGVVLKSINGIVFLTPCLRRILSSSRTVLLVRDGLAMCESRLRRGTFRDASKFGLVFRLVTEEMRRQVESDPSTVVLHFEDLLADPIGFTRSMYETLGLDPGVVDHVRLKSKPHLQSSGDVAAPRPGSHHFWVRLSDLPSVITSSIDEAQAQRLSDEQRRAFRSAAGSAEEWLRAARGTAHTS